MNGTIAGIAKVAAALVLLVGLIGSFQISNNLPFFASSGDHFIAFVLPLLFTASLSILLWLTSAIIGVVDELDRGLNNAYSEVRSLRSQMSGRESAASR